MEVFPEAPTKVTDVADDHHTPVELQNVSDPSLAVWHLLLWAAFC